MSSPGGWTRRLDKLQAALPEPPAGSPYWHDSFARLGYAFRLGDREPEYAGALKAYGGLRPPYGDEAERLHEHLCELLGRAVDKTPPCPAAEFATLAAWLTTHGDGLPGVGWPKAIDAGDGATVTLSDRRWRAGRGPTAVGQLVPPRLRPTTLIVAGRSQTSGALTRPSRTRDARSGMASCAASRPAPRVRPATGNPRRHRPFGGRAGRFVASHNPSPRRPGAGNGIVRRLTP